MKLINKARFDILMLAFALSGNIVHAQQEPPREHKTPFSYEFAIGGTTPTGNMRAHIRHRS